MKNSYNSWDTNYSHDDYLNNQKFLNDIYVKNIIRKSGIPRNSKILDVGCGQGYFSHLFNKFGMEVLGIDLSETGVTYARKHYGRDGLNFAVCDALNIPALTKYDCVFVRSISLYNTDNYEYIRSITKKLMEHVKEDGVFIFTYNVNFNKRKQSNTWKHHSLDDITQYFSDFQNKEIYFTSKVDCLIFGKYAFNKVFSHINVFASRIFGLGGEIVCFINP